MADTFEVFSLTSKLGLDTSQFDTAYANSRTKMKTLATDFDKVGASTHGLGTKINQTLRPSLAGLQSSITGLGGPLDGTISRMSSMVDVGGRLSLTTAGLGMGFGVLATGGIAAAAGIFALAKKAADAGDEINDLTQKVNFSAETISTLKNEGQLAGVEFSSLGTALGIFSKNADAAQSGNKQLAATFKALKVDLSDNEAALRSTFKALLAIEDENQQVALAMAIFGKSGKEVLGVIKSLHGDIDAATDKFRKMGSLITTESAAAANEFSDKLKILEQRFDGVTRSIGERFMPITLQALEAVSNAMDANSQHAATWADGVVAAVEFMAAQVKHILEGLAIVIEGFQKTFGKGSFFGDMIEGETKPRLLSIGDGKVKNLSTGEVFTIDEKGQITGGSGYQALGASVRYDDAGEYAIAGGAGSNSVGAGMGTTKKGGRLAIGGGGGGGRGGGGRSRDLLEEQKRALEQSLRATLAGMNAEEEGIERSYEQRRLKIESFYRAMSRLEENRHNEVVRTIDEEIKLANQIKDPAKRDEKLADLGIRKIEEANRHRRATWELEDKVKSVTRDRIALVDTLVSRLQREREVMKQINQERSRFKSEVEREDLGDGSFVLTPDVRDSTGRPRVATVDEQVARERARIAREHIQMIADDITDILDEAITAGMEGGFDDGVAAFGRAILRMAKHEALEMLRRAIANAMGGGTEDGSSGGGGKGGLFSTILNFGLSAITGLFGGGGSSGGLGAAAAGGIGGFAGGGYVSPNTWYWRGEKGPELAKSGPMGDTVMSHSDSVAMAGRGGNTYITVNARDAESFAARRTQTQIKRGFDKMARR